MENWDKNKVEYEKAIDLYKTYTTLRRQDLVYITLLQVGIFTLVKDSLFNLDYIKIILSGIGLVVCIIGWNNERRLSIYLKAALDRARNIEDKFGMSLLKDGREKMKKKYTISNAVTFQFYYLLIIAAWIYLFFINIFY